MRRVWPSWIVCLAVLAGAVSDAAGAPAAWSGLGPKATGNTRCRVQSVVERISDGYGQTPVQLVLDRHRLRVVTESNLDTGMEPLGLAVDDRAFVPADRVEHDKILVFDTAIDRIIAQFKAGNRVRLRLRFWPTWPDTGEKTPEFSLLGFSHAFDALAPCH
jgi:hypothetical protein